MNHRSYENYELDNEEALEEIERVMIGNLQLITTMKKATVDLQIELTWTKEKLTAEKEAKELAETNLKTEKEAKELAEDNLETETLAKKQLEIDLEKVKSERDARPNITLDKFKEITEELDKLRKEKIARDEEIGKDKKGKEEYDKLFEQYMKEAEKLDNELLKLDEIKMLVEVPPK